MFIAMLDALGLITYLSSSYDAILGDPGALIGKEFASAIHPDDRARIRAMLEETVKTGDAKRAEHRLLSRDGWIRAIESQMSPIRDAAGVVTRVLIVSRDVTERKSAEANRADAKPPLAHTEERIEAERITRGPGLARAIGRAILVVEDEPDILDPLKVILELSGFPVLTASDGLEAVELYRRNWEKIGLVISDVDLPKQSGVETFAEMREINPAAKVIFSTGSIDPEVRARLMRQGAIAFVEKPYLPTEIVRLVKSVMAV